MENPSQQQKNEQKEAILRAIAVSSLHLPQFTQHHRHQAFQILEEFKKFPGRVPFSIELLLQEHKHIYSEGGGGKDAATVGGGRHDITLSTKLLALEILDNFLVTGYSKCSEHDRIVLRQAVLQAARTLTAASSSAAAANTDGEFSAARILARKLAVILKGIVLRDFPQRWTTLATDLFAPEAQGGLWNVNDPTANASARNTMGIKICLECLKQVAEDCTDSDFNVKISTTRRNDVLIGLNEICHSFLPPMFGLLQSNYTSLQQSKVALHSMHQYLIGGSRTTSRMSSDEAAAYRLQVQIC
jgi:hypothetical protein